MAEETTQDNSVNLSDVIKEQSQTIDTLVSQVKKEAKSFGGQNQPIYNTTPQKTAKKPPNYTMYILIGVGIYLLLKKRII